MRGTKAELDRYLRQVSGLLDCPRCEKRIILEHVRLELMEIPGWEEMSQEQLEKMAGSPEELAEGYLLTGEISKVVQKQKEKKRFWFIIIGIAAVLALVFTLILIMDTADNFSYRDGYYIEKIDEGLSSSNQESNILEEY